VLGVEQIVYYKHHMHAASHLYELPYVLSELLAFENLSDKYDKHVVFHLGAFEDAA
jgi:hypothetical protein